MQNLKGDVRTVYNIVLVYSLEYIEPRREENKRLIA